MLPPTIRENDLPFLPHVGAGVGAGVASRYNRGYKVSTSKRCERGGGGAGKAKCYTASRNLKETLTFLQKLTIARDLKGHVQFFLQLATQFYC